MKLLFKIAFQNSRHLFLIGITVTAMVLLTFASQLEMFALGVITKSGPSFFELFAPVKDGKLVAADEISRHEVEMRWDQIDTAGKGYITKEEAARYLAKRKSGDIIAIAMNAVSRYVNVSGSLVNLAILIVAVALFKAATLFVHRFSTRLVAIRVSRDLRQNYFEHIQSLPMSFFQEYNIGSLSARVVGDAPLIAEAVNACLMNYLQTPFTVLTTLALCFITSWQLSLIIFLGLPLLIVPIVFLTKRVKKISKQIQQNQEHFASVLIDFLSGIQTVKVFAMEEFSLKKYREHNHRMASLEKRSARYDLSTRPVVHTIAMIFLATAMMYGLFVLRMSVAEVLFYCGLMYLFYEPIKKFAEENSHIQRGISAAERVLEVMALKPHIEDRPNALDLKEFNEQIEFRDVWFRYGGNWVLQGLNFKVRRGETVAIVGPTGAGKSTIVQLLPRLYDIQQGEILIDGKPIHCFSQKSLRENIAFVPQKPFLFLDTVAENIAFGRQFTNEQIQAAAKRAHADEFICRLPEGYQTLLIETGKNLSGGQQQRLAIARALVKEAPILIMDEATSSLDAISEHRIKCAIRDLRGQVTQIIIAHRLSTIDDADRILYIEQGKIVAEGSKDELILNCPKFREMWHILHKETRENREILR